MTMVVATSVIVTVVVLNNFDLWKVTIKYFISRFQLYIECLYDPTVDCSGVRSINPRKADLLRYRAQISEWKEYNMCDSRVCIT